MRRAMMMLLVAACGPESADAPWSPPPKTNPYDSRAHWGVTAEKDAPPPNPTPPDPNPANPMGPSTMPGMSDRKAPPAPSDCADNSSSPITSETDARNAGGPGLTRTALIGGKAELLTRMHERHGGLDKSYLQQPHDSLQLGRFVAAPRNFGPGFAAGDRDGDCLPDADEIALGTNPDNPDTDGDGWFDGACNERRKLFVQSVIVHSSQDWCLFGGDDFYLIADDVRYPNNGLNDYWDGLCSGDTQSVNRLIASRTVGIATGALAQVTVEGWEDDFEIFNTWTVDDLLFSEPIDLAAYHDGDTFTRRYTTGDYDYEVSYRVEIERFADPDPLHDGDSDNDGIKESAEAKVAAQFGGITDPMRPDILVEVDWMTGHRLRTEAKRQVVTRLFEHGYQLFVWRDEEVPANPCLSVKGAQSYYKKYFTNADLDAFRYSLVGEKIWNNASGVTWGDMFLVNDSTWWIDDSVLPQAGTFIHELGHTLSMTKQDTFHLIDSISWLSYDSAMNYTFQALLVDYDDDGAPGDAWHHNDWGDVKPGYALQWSFALVNSDEVGICK
jgi:hypothetical protein